MQSLYKIALVVTLCVTVFSCKKEGLGGDATVVALLKHHDHIIPNQANYPDTVFVKFDAKEFPGNNPSDYDAFFTGHFGEDHVQIEGLKPGNYFLFGVGIDSSIVQRVKGGVAIKIKHKEKDEEIQLDIPVTED